MLLLGVLLGFMHMDDGTFVHLLTYLLTSRSCTGCSYHVVYSGVSMFTSLVPRLSLYDRADTS